MKNRLHTLFQDTSRGKVSLYFTAGFPKLDDTTSILQSIEKAGIDFVEIGFPFSDPLADGPTIQQSSQVALANGMSLSLLFEQLQDIRSTISMPLILMGYLNPVLQFGMERFIQHCKNVGIDGLILPDLPVDIYLEEYESLFKENGISYIPLITPSTSEERIRFLDKNTDGFIYMVSTHATTGGQLSLKDQEAYFKRIQAMQLTNPTVVGFGIQSKDDIDFVSQYCNGAIIGSAFIRQLEKDSSDSAIGEFVKHLN